LDYSVLLNNFLDNDLLRHLNNSWEQDELFQFCKEFLNYLDMDDKCRIGSSKFFNFDQQQSDIGFKIFGEQFVSLFMGSNVNANGNAQCFLFDDFMYIF
jgi:hypothetical protein